MANTLTIELGQPYPRRDSSNLLSPPRSPRRPPHSPPPSASLLKLQKWGLELGPSTSSLSLNAPSYNSSIRTTPSDLDKPLPLEPPEIDRRASSVYSVETTISNILDLYGGNISESNSQVFQRHRSQAYRDTVAPLMARRYSDAESPPPLPLIIRRSSGAESPPPLIGFPEGPEFIVDVPRATIPPPSIYHDDSPPISPTTIDLPPLPVPSPSNYPEMSPPLSPAESKDAPSFTEFARNLPQKRFDIVSPLSDEGSEGYHRQLAMDALAPPSPQESPSMHPVAFDRSDGYLPGPMSGTITHVVASDMMPPPLDLNRISRSASSQGVTSQSRAEQENNSFEDFLLHSARPNSSIASSTDKFNHAPIQTPSASKEVLGSQRFTAQEKERIMSYPSEKYPGMKDISLMTETRVSTRSSMSKRASSLMRAMSIRKTSVEAPKAPLRSDTAATTKSEYAPPRKNLAIQPTSYQLYGEAAWDKYDKKKRKKYKRTSGGSNKTDDGEKRGFFEGAKHKLTRTASEKRREKLKNSIKLVGNTEITEQRHARDEARRWWD